jgi:hypothetical protein
VGATGREEEEEEEKELMRKFNVTFCTQSVEMERAVYESEWYNRSGSFKRMVQLVIARAQRPVSLTAGKLYIVSMETFAKVSNLMYTKKA